MNKIIIRVFCFALSLLGLFSLQSCRSYKHIPYFKDLPDSIYNQSAYSGVSVYKEPIIQANDLLHIATQTLDPNAPNLLGTSRDNSHSVQAMSTSSSAVSKVEGFMVDKAGDVELPLVGKIRVAGKTTTEARELIQAKIAVYYKEAVVTVRFANFSISVIGEVVRPAQYIVANEKVSILDAIAMSGDLTIYGKRENVLLIREVDGVKEFTRFNLSSSDIFHHPKFYLKQGDVIYIEPNKAKAASNDLAQARNLTIISSFLSLAIIIASRVRF